MQISGTISGALGSYFDEFEVIAHNPYGVAAPYPPWVPSVAPGSLLTIKGALFATLNTGWPCMQWPIPDAPVTITIYRVTPNGLEPTTFGDGSPSITVTVSPGMTVTMPNFSILTTAPVQQSGTYVIKAYYPGTSHTSYIASCMGKYYEIDGSIGSTETSVTMLVHPIPSPSPSPTQSPSSTTQQSTTPTVQSNIVFDAVKYIPLSVLVGVVAGAMSYFIVHEHPE